MPTMTFQGAHKFAIGTAIFNAVTSSSKDPFDVLHNARAVEATHTSSTAMYAPKCKPGTRTKIIGDMVHWMETGKTPMLWFSGPAGGGKTCIMREVAALCQSVGFPTWTYFFSTRVPGLDVERPFVATIAHQLILDIPALKPSVFQAISENPNIFHESLDFQMEKLIVEPLVGPHQPNGAAIVIDGFDECREPKERQHLLRILGRLIDKLPQSILIILASRPELDIRTAFEELESKLIAKTMRLEDYDGKDDVRDYCCDEFAKIRATHPLKKLIPEDWPVEVVLNTLLDKSSGYFLLPSVVFKYISNPRQNPVESLNKLMSASANITSDAKNPFAELDAIYSFILHPPETDLALMKRLLHLIIGCREHEDSIPTFTSPAFLEEFLGLPDGAVETTFCDLHSMLSISESRDDNISFYHKSSVDYLLSPTRSRDLFQDRGITALDYALTCTQIIQTWALYPQVSEADISTVVEYAHGHWPRHILAALKMNASPIRNSFPDTILQFDPRHICIFRFITLQRLDDWTPSAVFGGFDDLRSTFHAIMCTETSCLRFCKILGHIQACQWPSGTSGPLAMLYEKSPQQTRPIDVLAQFKVQTGLYDPTIELH